MVVSGPVLQTLLCTTSICEIDGSTAAILLTEGILVLIYLEYWLIIHQDCAQVTLVRDSTLDWCNHLGLIVNHVKLCLTLTMTLKCLGVEIHLEMMEAYYVGQNRKDGSCALEVHWECRTSSQTVVESTRTFLFSRETSPRRTSKCEETAVSPKQVLGEIQRRELWHSSSNKGETRPRVVARSCKLEERSGFGDSESDLVYGCIEDIMGKMHPGNNCIGGCGREKEGIYT